MAKKLFENDYNSFVRATVTIYESTEDHLALRYQLLDRDRTSSSAATEAAVVIKSFMCTICYPTMVFIIAAIMYPIPTPGWR